MKFGHSKTPRSLPESKRLCDKGKDCQMMIHWRWRLSDDDANMCKDYVKYYSLILRNEAPYKGLNAYANKECESKM